MKVSRFIGLVKEILSDDNMENCFDRELVRALINIKAKGILQESGNVNAIREIINDVSNNVENLTDEELQEVKRTMSKFLSEDEYYSSVIIALVKTITMNKSGNPSKMFA